MARMTPEEKERRALARLQKRRKSRLVSLAWRKVPLIAAIVTAWLWWRDGK